MKLGFDALFQIRKIMNTRPHSDLRRVTAFHEFLAPDASNLIFRKLSKTCPSSKCRRAQETPIFKFHYFYLKEKETSNTRFISIHSCF